MSDVDPLLDDGGAVVLVQVGVLQHGRDDAVRHGVELVDGGVDAGRVRVALLAPRPHRPEAVVRHHLLEQLLWKQHTRA